MPDGPLRRTGLVLDERAAGHVNPPGGLAFGMLPAWVGVEAFERPERVTLTARVLEGAGVLEHVRRLPARPATRAELALVHTQEHIDRVHAAAGGVEAVKLGHEAWIGPGSLEPALLAVGGLLDAVDAVCDGALDTAFVVMRPPGHHAEPDAAMGFCLFAATAIAARHAQRRPGVDRVAILDWDVHHGNGTEAAFLDDPSVLCVSLHQEALYPPDTGGLEARGIGAGAGANVNVPLPAGTGDDGYALAWDAVVAPVVRAFAPDLILVGAGQDPSATDPLGRMSVTVPGFRMLADRAVDLAGICCEGRLVAFLEGGYSLQHTPLGNLAVLEGLAGLPPTFPVDPVGADVPRAIAPAVRAAVAAARAAHLGT